MAMSSGGDTVGTALWYADQIGWPVVPGWPMVRSRCGCGRPGCDRPGVHPVERAAPLLHGAGSGEDLGSVDPAVIRTLWSERDWRVLLPAGLLVDVLEVPFGLGWYVWRRLLDSRPLSDPRLPCPVSARPPDAVAFWTVPAVDGEPVWSRDTAGSRRGRRYLTGARHVGKGGYVLAPATPDTSEAARVLDQGRHRWLCTPQDARTDLFSTGDIVELLADAGDLLAEDMAGYPARRASGPGASAISVWSDPETADEPTSPDDLRPSPDSERDGDVPPPWPPTAWP
jgi:hypothetical protein